MKSTAHRFAFIAALLYLCVSAVSPARAQTITVSVPVHPRYINDITLPLMIFQQSPTSVAHQVDWLDKNGAPTCWVDSDGLISCTAGSGFGVSIQRNGVFVGTQQTVNFIEGANVTIGAANDTMNNRVSLTFSSSGAGGGDESMQVDGVAIGTQPIFNFITGTGVTLLGADDPGSTRVNLTITAAPGVPGDVLDTQTNRWASIVWICSPPISSESSEGIFDDWVISATTSRTCSDGTYLFPYVTWTTSTAANSFHDQISSKSWPLAANPRFSMRASVADRVNGFRRWIGWTDTSALGMHTTDNPTNANVIAFWTCQDNTTSNCNPDSGSSTLWCVTKNGTTITRQDSGLVIVNNQIYLFQIFYDSTIDTATFKVDGATVCSMNADMPLDTTLMAFFSGINNTSGAGVGLNYSERAHGIYLYSALPVP